jgi:benzil reductase ((S)-benzoin forming)
MKNVIIITGTNRGLGKAFVDVLINKKDIFIISISRSLTREQADYSSKRFSFLNIDLSKDDLDKKITVLKDSVDEQKIYFINNASIIEPIAKIEDLDTVEIDKVISVNIKSTILITKYLLGNFKANQITFVNITSGAANRAISNWSLYCSSKAFIKMFYSTAEKEYSQHRFFNIDPGVMDTNMQKSLRESDFPAVKNFKNLQNDGKLKSPKEVAGEILKTIGFN